MKIFCPAKINLYLKVLGRRPDGYHELRTVMVPLAFGDTIDIHRTSRGIELDAADCGCTPAENLAFRAARLFFDTTGAPGGVRMRIHKRIPVGAGLGGGSSDASGVLLALNEMFGTGMDAGALAQTAKALGADCPFFIYRRPMFLGSRGDVPIAEIALEERSYLIVVPPVHVSTARVFAKMGLHLTRGIVKDIMNPYSNQCIVPEHWVENDLESATFDLYPEIAGIRDELIGAGALRAGMSGSGSAFFGIFATQDHMRHAMGRLRRHEGYVYIPTTRMTGDMYGDHRGQGVSGQG